MIGAEDDADDGDQVVVQLHPGVVEGGGEADGGKADHEDLAQDHHEVRHLVHEEPTDNVGASLILFSSCRRDSFCSYVHTIQQLLPGFISRLCLGVLMIIS